MAVTKWNDFYTPPLAPLLILLIASITDRACRNSV